MLNRIARRPTVREVAEISAIVVACLAAVLYIAPQPLNHDVSWYLVSTRSWLDGATLYRDILEVNPPLAYYDIAAALQLPLPDKISFVTTLCFLIGLSCLWARDLLRRANMDRPYLTIANLAVLLIVPLDNFGQREHILLVIGLPYFWATALEVRRGRIESIAIGCYAFLGLGLKPYFLAIPLSMTIAKMVRQRSYRPIVAPENIIIAALCGLYLVSAVILHPAYFNYIVPIARMTYFAYGEAPATVLTRPALLLSIPIIAAGFWARGPSAVWTAGLLGAVIAYLIQFKGWDYHLIPVSGFSLVVCVLVLAQAAVARRRRPLAITCIAAMGITLAIVPAVHGGYRLPEPYFTLRPTLRGAKSVLILGENVWLTYPLVEEMGVHNVSRYCALWPLPGASIIAVDATDPRRSTARAILIDTRTIVVGDFVRTPPDVLVVDERKYKPYFRGPFDYIAFLRGDPRFDRVFADYADSGMIGPLHIYRRMAGLHAPRINAQPS